MRLGVSRIVSLLIVVVIIIVAVAGFVVYEYTVSSTSPSSSNVISVAMEIGAADASDIPMMHAMLVDLKQFGYTANVQVYTGQAPADAALIGGTANVLTGTPNEGPELYSKVGAITFGIGYYGTDEVLVCTSNITSVAQLAQQHITVGMTSLTDTSYVVPAIWLNYHGYNASNVNWIVVPGAAGRGAALLSGKIPCGATDVTSTIGLLAQPGHKFHILATLASLAQTSVFTPFIDWITTKSYLETHQAECLALLKANLLAYRWAHNETAYLSYGPSIVGASINTTLLSQSYDLLSSSQIDIWDKNLPWNTTVAQNIANVTGLYNLGAPYISPAKWANFTLYQQAIAAVGTAS